MIMRIILNIKQKIKKSPFWQKGLIDKSSNTYLF